MKLSWAIRKYHRNSSTLNIENWNVKIQSLNPVIEHDVVSSSLINLFDMTLKDLVDTKHSQSKLSPGRHFALFPSRIPQNLLAVDGYTNDAPPGLPHRMWAGGNLLFNIKNPLVMEEKVSQTTIIENITESGGARGSSITVNSTKTISNTLGFSIKETRKLIHVENPAVKSRAPSRNSQADFSHSVLISNVSAFRFSALTFNSHRIHYDQEYARKVEGYDNCLLHGPFTCTLLLDLFRLHNPYSSVLEFDYKAISPLYVGDLVILNGRELTCSTERPDEKRFELWATNSNGGLAMKGTLSCV
jgi:3-methylfumaryl-CoA hydratase